ncbi:hypothetical protein PV327_008113 [Microctonus hyperodae]|uniref:Uncharacterized protein n=1 Tax=Microctonus hyperodae TaxID=165561 RepID=A0AA39KGL1_MICHY|nr:hypothetical protein PV327_008113 [Microctonus hyperodae]
MTSKDMVNKSNASSHKLDSTIPVKSSSEDGDTKPCKLVKEYALMGQTSFRRSQKLSEVRQILANDYHGEIIQKNYKKTKLLSRKSANIIVDVIISKLLKDHDRLTNVQLENIAKSIVEIFPTESIKTYYIAPISKAVSCTKKSIPSRGKLVDKYRNKLRQRKILSEVVKTQETSVVESDDKDNDKKVTQSVEWLKINRAPWKDVLHHWQLTFYLRRKSIEKNKDRKVNLLFEQWPILKQPNGYLLIESDFRALKLTDVIITKEIWETFFQNVRTVVSLSDLLILDDVTDDCRVVIQTLLLSHYVPPKGRIRVQEKHVKFSIPDCKNSMIVQVARSDDIAMAQENIEIKSAQSRMPLQPYMIVVGETMTRISEFYVCVDRVRYKLHSALSALDLLFKIFHVLDTGYPLASEHLWMLMQRSLYKFVIKGDKSISYVETIVKQVSNLEAKRSTENNVQ